MVQLRGIMIGIAILLMSIAGQAQSQNWLQLNTESLHLYQLGEYEQSLKISEQTLAFAKELYGEKSNQYLISLSNKGYTQSALGQYLQTVETFRDVAQLSLYLYSLPHVSQMESFGELSKTFMQLGTYDSAEHYLNLAKQVYLSINKKNKAHQDTAVYALLNAFIKINSVESSLFHKRGQEAEAIQLLEEQLPLLRQIYPNNYKTVADYQRTIYNLSNYYGATFKPIKAKEYAQKYYSLVKNNKNELDLIFAFQALGNAYRNLEQYDSAIYYWSIELATLESSSYKYTYIHTALLNNLGELYSDLEHYDEAILYLQKSLDIQLSKEAINPPLYQTTLSNLAESYRWAGKYAQADSIYSTLMQGLLDEIRHNFTYLSDAEKLAFYLNQLYYIDNFNSFALEVSGKIALQESNEPYIAADIAGRMYDLQLTTKAIILNASKRMKSTILASKNERLKTVYTLWEERKNSLAQALQEGNLPLEELELLEQEIEANEKWLIANSQSFKTGFYLEEVSWKNVQKSLKTNEAAVEIIRLVDGHVYGVLILTSETTEQPILCLVMSSLTKHLEKEYYNYYHNSIIYKQHDTLSYQIYWKPIIESIQKNMPNGAFPKRIYVSNDGIYNQINLNTLFDTKRGEYVLAQSELIILSNTKEIINPTNMVKTGSVKKGALFGQPTFAIGVDKEKTFSDLVGTGLEVELIDSILVAAQWETEVFIGADATETNVKSLEATYIVHLASHGFFNPSSNGLDNSLVETMMQSGIVLANDSLSVNSANDGILTAYEVLSLDLDATHLVVLSACETGLGVDNPGEGVYGLQRALQVAGAQFIIMSLWKVDDAITQQLMTAFYSHWVQSNDLREAFRTAQLLVQETQPSPYYWGAFILTGR